jgi:hypothetical protein
MHLRKLTAADLERHGWTSEDWEELQQLSHSDGLDEAGYWRWNELSNRLSAANRALQDELAREVAPTLTREQVEELERRALAWDESMTQEEHQILSLAQKLSEPKGRKEEAAAWDKWYQRSIADSLFGPSRPPERPSTTSSATRVSPRRRASRPRRIRRTRRARSPSRNTDDDPELAAQLAGLIAEHGPQSASWLSCTAGRRKASVLAALHARLFVRVGRGRASRWDVLPQAPAGLTPERLEATFAEVLNGNGDCLPQGFAGEVLHDLERQRLVVRAPDGSYLRTTHASNVLGEFWAVA